MSKLPEYVLDREFDAPRALVWRAWSEPELLNKWYGPGVETIIHEFDLKPGGMWLNEMKWGDNSHFQKVVFKEITQPDLMVWDHYSATDKDWNTIANPMMPDWPALLLTTVTFTQTGDKTKLRLSQTPVAASDAELACFASAMGNMDKGWGSGFEVMDGLLAKLQA